MITERDALIAYLQMLGTLVKFRDITPDDAPAIAEVSDGLAGISSNTLHAPLSVLMLRDLLRHRRLGLRAAAAQDMDRDDAQIPLRDDR